MNSKQKNFAPTSTHQSSKSVLYDTDFDLWIADTVAKLKNREFDHLDLENLIDEVESLSKRDRRELVSRLRTLFEHLLKRHFVNLPDCFNGWAETISRTQTELEEILLDSPRLRTFANDLILICYKKALRNASKGYPQVIFPENCPFSQDIDRLITEDFFP